MGCCLGNYMDERPLHEFLNVQPGAIRTILEVPIPSRKRNLTDVVGFILLFPLIALLMGLLIYTLTHSNPTSNPASNRTADSCGNICGIANKQIENVSCSGADYRDKPAQVRFINGTTTCEKSCFSLGFDILSCHEQEQINERETHRSTLKYSRHEISDNWYNFLILLGITIALCFITMVSFRFITKIIFYGSLIFGIFAFWSLSFYFWYSYSDTSKLAEGMNALFLTIVAVVVTLLTIACWDRIALVVILYKETTKIMSAIPIILLIPPIILILQCVICVAMVIVSMFVSTASHQQIGANTENENSMMNVIFTTLFLNVIMTVFAVKFLAGYQFMVIAGCAAQWYFKRNSLQTPALTSIIITTQNHLGSIAYGSLILMMIFILKIIVYGLLSNEKCSFLIKCCCENIEECLTFLSNMAYVEIAIYGQSFCKSGRRVAFLFLSNATSLVVINTAGSFVIGVVSFILVTVITSVAYYLFMNSDYVYILVGLAIFMNAIVVATTFSLFKTLVDSLFVCYCEDISLNDGSVTKPYYMSPDFKEFVDKSEEYRQKHTNVRTDEN